MEVQVYHFFSEIAIFVVVFVKNKCICVFYDVKMCVFLVSTQNTIFNFFWVLLLPNVCYVRLNLNLARGSPARGTMALASDLWLHRQGCRPSALTSSARPTRLLTNWLNV